MTDAAKILEMIEKSGNGMVSTAQVEQAGIHRDALCRLVASGKLYRYERGMYMRPDAWEDELYLLQQRYRRGIFSHETAAFLHGYSDRTPARYTMTFPKGYNTSSLQNENLRVIRVVAENYNMGVIEYSSPCGNPIRIYNLERTLCDMLRGSGCDIQIVNSAMKRYAASKEKNIHQLLQYAEQLRVKPKVMRYMEVLL